MKSHRALPVSRSRRPREGTDSPSSNVTLPVSANHAVPAGPPGYIHGRPDQPHGSSPVSGRAATSRRLRRVSRHCAARDETPAGTRTRGHPAVERHLRRRHQHCPPLSWRGADAGLRAGSPRAYRRYPLRGAVQVAGFPAWPKARVSTPLALRAKETVRARQASCVPGLLAPHA
jgi:hypothetical protein